MATGEHRSDAPRSARGPANAKRRSFPGGRPALPLLNEANETDGPSVHYVESAFLHSDRADDDRPASGFESYFTVESLFEKGDEPTQRDDDAWQVLGVSRDAPWAEVVQAHRRLARQFHPDRFPLDDVESRRDAEQQIRLINQAFADIREVMVGTRIEVSEPTTAR